MLLHMHFLELCTDLFFQAIQNHVKDQSVTYIFAPFCVDLLVEYLCRIPFHFNFFLDSNILLLFIHQGEVDWAESDGRKHIEV